MANLIVSFPPARARYLRRRRTATALEDLPPQGFQISHPPTPQGHRRAPAFCFCSFLFFFFFLFLFSFFGGASGECPTLSRRGVGGSRYAPSRGRKSGFSIAPLSPGFYPYTVHHNYSLLVTQDCRRLGKPRGRRLRSCTGVAVRRGRPQPFSVRFSQRTEAAEKVPFCAVCRSSSTGVLWY